MQARKPSGFEGSPQRKTFPICFRWDESRSKQQHGECRQFRKSTASCMVRRAECHTGRRLECSQYTWQWRFDLSRFASDIGLFDFKLSKDMKYVTFNLINWLIINLYGTYSNYSTRIHLSFSLKCLSPLYWLRIYCHAGRLSEDVIFKLMVLHAQVQNS